MAHARPREEAIAEARANAKRAGHHAKGDQPLPVRIDNAPDLEQGWLIAIATDGNAPLEGVMPSAPFRDIVGESHVGV